jgi:hypothetical protein
MYNAKAAIVVGVGVLLTATTATVIHQNRPPKYGGGSSSSEAISNSTDHLCYAIQHWNLLGGTSDVNDDYRFVVLWRAKRVGGMTNVENGLVTTINHHPISADVHRRAVYALQPDYSLKELSLTPAEIDQLFSSLREARDSKAEQEMMQRMNKRHRKPVKVKRLQDDEVFKTKVLSQLARVETPD